MSLSGSKTPLLIVLGIACVPCIAVAHGATEQFIETELVPTRLFTADAETGAVLAINLPTGNVVARLSTPPFVMLLGLSPDRRHLFAMRGRNTDRDWITVIDTGFDPETRMMRGPHVARTILGDKPAGVIEGRLTTVDSRIAVFMEGTGELQVFTDNKFSTPESLSITTYALGAPDHYHYLETDRYLYVGHFRNGFLQILDRDDGREVGRIGNCAGLHGMGRDEATGRLFFACRADVLVVGTKGAESNREVARIAYPERRLGTLLQGKDRVLWGYDEGAMPSLYRLDAARQPYSFNALPIDSSIHQRVTADRSRLLVLTWSGELQVRDAWSGSLIRTVDIARPFAEDLKENTDKAVLPDIDTEGNRAYISLPHQGQIAEVDLDEGAVLRYFDTGGQPTRVVLLKATAGLDGIDIAASTQYRWYEPDDVQKGRKIYAIHCAGCHGGTGQGGPGWGQQRVQTADAAPPLNGTGHAYKHPLDDLLATISKGSPSSSVVGMPGFGELLSSKEQRTLVAYFQSLWPASVYAAWRIAESERHSDH